MFMHYNQNVAGFEELQHDDERIERKFHLRAVYKKFKHKRVNLLCFGCPSSAKSSLLNNMLGLELEVVYDNSLGLFHDSIDAVFSDAEVPMGFNVFDFQGRLANTDFTLIKKLLKKMPKTYILLQVDSEDYLELLAENID